MDGLAVILVLTAAVMHATWNAIVKVEDDRLVTMAVMIGTTGLLAPLLLLLGPAPAPESWPYIGLSAFLNNVYFLFLIEAYRVGDLSHAYPLARGSAPLMVAGGAALFAGEHLSGQELAGVAIISAGIIGLMVVSGSGLKGGWRSIVYPLATGMMIAAYTVVDGIGVRLSGNPAGYIGWLFILSPIPLVAIALARQRGATIAFLRGKWRTPLLGGFLNMGSYGLAIWALSISAMAQVSALRETSVVIAVLIGTFVLKEPMGRHRMMASVAVAFGVLLIVGIV
jgi:drug/metabolite transporter (DMT)-like permease